MTHPRRVVLETDGGSRGNPGPAGYGAVLREADTRKVLAERAAGIGRATNNVAEYRGLIAGLEAAIELGAEAVDVQMDSKLIVEQMSGRWKIKHPDMQPLAQQAHRLIRQLPQVSFTWIPRGRNSHADRLANEAMDAAAVGRTWSGPAAPVWTPDAASTAATRTLLLRHGQTEHSIDKRFSGRNDLPLTAVGEQQAAAAARRIAAVLAPAAIVSSPLRRTRQTAQAVAELTGLPVTVDDDLMETDFGSWEGLTAAEVRTEQQAHFSEWLASVDVAPPGGESFAAAGRRVRRARLRLLSAYGGQPVLVVSHVTPIKLLLQAGLDAGPSVLFRVHLDLASLSTVDWYDDGRTSVRLVNDTSHLMGAEGAR